MKTITEQQKKILLEMLINDVPFSKIKKELNLGVNYNLKSLCEYLGHKYAKAYEIHINNFPKNSITNRITDNETLTKEDFLKGMDFLLSQMKENKNNTSLLENKDVKNNQENDIFEVIELPKILPQRLQGENYQVKQTSVKVVDNVWQEFQQFVKTNKRFSSIEYLSLAILEFLEKYRSY